MARHPRHIRRLTVSGLAVISLLSFASGAARIPSPGETLRVSVGHEGQQAKPNESNGYWGQFGSVDADVSDDGRYVVFSSISDNLVPGDTNGHWDVFLRDLVDETTILVSAAPDGTSGNEDSRWPSISSDGSEIIFTSRASDLVPGDTDQAFDIFFKDMSSGNLSRVSIRSDGTEDHNETNGGAISGNGRFAAFWASPTFLGYSGWLFAVQIVVRDLVTGEVEVVSVNDEGDLGDQGSWDPQLSHDGRFVTFTSWARNLGPVPAWPGCYSCHSGVYVRDRHLDKTHTASIDEQGGPLEDDSYDPVITDDGRYVMFTNLSFDEPKTIGSYSVLTRDLVSGTTTNETRGALQTLYDDAYQPSISADGRYIAFTSRVVARGPDLNPLWSDVYLKDRMEGTIELVSVDSAGRQGPLSNSSPALSRDGRYLVWESGSPTMVEGDTNLMDDIFIRRLVSSSL